MNAALRRDADVILRSSLNAVLPDEAVRRALRDLRPGKGRVLLVAAGKAAWQMAHAAVETLGRVDGGVVVTKYGHVKGEIPGVTCYEAGHPVPDENGFAATQKALELVQGLTAGDTVLDAIVRDNRDEPHFSSREEIEASAKNILTRLGIYDFDEKVEHLSGGQRKRVALASVLMSTADLLILDEPTNHLDSGMADWLEE